MSFNFILPTPITDSLFVASNVPETDYQEWALGTAYAVGDTVKVTNLTQVDVHGIYQCLVAGSAGLAADILDEDCSDISDWTKVTGDLFEVSPAGQFHIQNVTDVSTNGDRLLAAPNTFTIEIKTYFDLITSPVAFFLTWYLADIRIRFRFLGTALDVTKAGGAWNSIGANIVKSGTTAAWQTWRFQVDKTVPASATVEVFLKEEGADFVSQGTFDCDWEPGVGNTSFLLWALGVGANLHIDYIRIATGLGRIATLADSPAGTSSAGNSDWLEVSATNRWKAFDGTLGMQTSRALAIEYVLAPGAIDSVALLNIESTTVQIVEIDTASDLVTNGQSWTGATGTTQPTSWDKVGTPSNTHHPTANQPPSPPARPPQASAAGSSPSPIPLPPRSPASLRRPPHPRRDGVAACLQRHPPLLPALPSSLPPPSPPHPPNPTPFSSSLSRVHAGELWGAGGWVVLGW